MFSLFETLAAATKPQNKCRFSIYRECVKVLLKVKFCEDVNECSKLCNEIFAIHQKHTSAKNDSIPFGNGLDLRHSRNSLSHNVQCKERKYPSIW